MGVFASRTTSSFSSSATPHNKAKAVAVGDVLNGKYVVKAVEEDENGQPQYKCATLQDHEEVLVRCEGCKDNADNALLGPPSHCNPRAVVPISDGESSCLDRFEVPSESNAHIADVQAKRRNQKSARLSGFSRDELDCQGSDSDIEDPRPVEEPEQRPAPGWSDIVIYKRGDANLEVDIPPSWNSVGFLIYYACCAASSFGSTCFVQAIFLASAISALTPVKLLVILSLAPLWCYGFVTMQVPMRAPSERHVNLTITPTKFRIKRTVALGCQNRDSVNNAAKAEAKLTFIDRIFCKQVEGATSDLTIATTREVTDRYGCKCEYVVLLEGQQQHKLCASLLKDERDWLLSEINKTLHEIKEKSRCRPQKRALAKVYTKQIP